MSRNPAMAVVIEGGLVQTIIVQAWPAEIALPRIVIVDYDIEGASDDEITRFSIGSDPAEAFCRGEVPQVYEALAGKGRSLVNTPAQYVHCHYLPESYEVIEDYTPRSVWMRSGPDLDIDAILKHARGEKMPRFVPIPTGLVARRGSVRAELPQRG